jgi:type III secretory pathway component EscV
MVLLRQLYYWKEEDLMSDLHNSLRKFVTGEAIRDISIDLIMLLSGLIIGVYVKTLFF